MLGTVFYQDTFGIDYNEFMLLYKEDLKGKEGIEVLFEKINSFTPDVKEDENQFIRRSERLGGERLMWLTRDMSDPNNELKFHIEFHKDFDIIIEKYKKQIASRLTPITDGMIKPHIVKYLDRIQYVVSTIKEQTQSEIGQDTSRRETLEEVGSLIPRPIDLRNPSEMGDNMNSPTYLSVLNTPSPSRVSGETYTPEPELSALFPNRLSNPIAPRLLTFAEEAAQNPVDSPQINYPRAGTPIPRTAATAYATQMKRRNNDQ